MSDNLPFALPDIGEDEIAAVVSAIRSGWVTAGPKVKEFETEFVRSLGRDDLFPVAVSSATAGLHLALEAIGIGPGDEVLVPTWTFTATAEVVVQLGASPVLVDVEQSTLNVDLADAASKVTSRTRAIMPVHFAGLPVPIRPLKDFAGAFDIDVVEDAAHAFPCTSGGVRVGASDSAATVFSFYATKTITTGEGGMVVTPNESLAMRMRTMRLHGISRDVFDRYRSATPAWHYEVVAPGFKYNLTDPAAAMGLIQLQRSTQMRNRRAEIAGRYHEAFSDIGLELPRDAIDGQHSWHLYVVRGPGDDGWRERFISRLADLGVSTSVHFIPLHLHPYWQQYSSLAPDDLPTANREFQRVVSLPIYSSMTDIEVERVIDGVRKVMAE